MYVQVLNNVTKPSLTKNKAIYLYYRSNKPSIGCEFWKDMTLCTAKLDSLVQTSPMTGLFYRSLLLTVTFTKLMFSKLTAKPFLKCLFASYSLICVRILLLDFNTQPKWGTKNWIKSEEVNARYWDPYWNLKKSSITKPKTVWRLAEGNKSKIDFCDDQKINCLNNLVDERGLILKFEFSPHWYGSLKRPKWTYFRPCYSTMLQTGVRVYLMFKI